MRSDVAIAPQARPGGGALPTPSEPRGSYTRKAAGRSCRRRARPDLSHHDRRRCPATSPLGQGAPPDEAACLSLDRPPAAASGPSEGRGLRIAGAASDATDASAPERPPSAPEAGLDENDLAFRLDDRSGRAEAAASQATDAGRLALGRAAAARRTRHTRRSSLQGRAASGRGPTLSRTVRSVTRVPSSDNRAAARRNRRFL